jgi:hypothetical protein
MVKKMGAAEFMAWRNLYTKRLDHLRRVVVDTTAAANEGLIESKEARVVIDEVNQEINIIIECGRLLNSLRKGSL